MTSLAELRATALDPADVVVFSDETDPAWWEGVAELGWKRVDHEALGTSASRDNWYPTLIDGVLMASAKGFSQSPSAAPPFGPPSLRPFLPLSPTFTRD